ncbi:NEL-type E3 ubiquitin ligase domain-containing protein [Pseudomonas parafulva]|uniref:NEL-type E3 ubiquitin ligase domain-containing protein n=1 Tax=Pseudomonas parafulva TaxID=157782 RepID=UPI0003F5392A|nr:NEL-type E3 ubiquitin ligase domain-containing protein [Pseudomonas parafulva]
MDTTTQPNLLEQAGQDRLLAAQLPTWLKAVSHQHMPIVCQALRSSLACRQRLSVRWAAIEGIDHFVTPLLQAALAQRHGVSVPVDQLWFRNAYQVPLLTYAPIRVPLTQRVYYQIPLLEAVLRNFTADEATPGILAPGAGLHDGAGQRLREPHAAQFARLVRELDLGARYQAHLQAHLAPAAMVAVLGELTRHEMLIDAFKARARGVLTEAELGLLINLWRDGRLGPLQGDRVVAKNLEVLGCPLQQIVVLDVRDESLAPFYTSSRRVLVYIPGDPQGAWSAAENLARFARKVLNARLREKPYQQFFARFVRRRDSQGFFAKLATRFYHDIPAWATADLYPRAYPLPGPLFESLALARIAQIQSDAATLLPPVQQLDRDREQAHEQRLAAEGWTLLGLASLWVPGIGAVLLAVTVWSLLQEAFYALDAWHEGEAEQALEHLDHVATDLALVAAGAAGVHVVRQAWKRSAWVDSLVQANVQGGGERLWAGDLAPFHSEQPPRHAVTDAQGVSRTDAHAWIRMDGQAYRVQQRPTDGQWQLLPRDGYGPLLQHNGAGAWRLWSESPMDWQGTRYLFRRLGGPMAELDDSAIDHVLAVHGLDDAQLRALHLSADACAPGLIDTALRAGLEQRLRGLVAQLRAGGPADDLQWFDDVITPPFEQGRTHEQLANWIHAQRRPLLHRLYQALPQPDDEGCRALRRVFPRLYGSAAQGLLRRASQADLERLRLTGRVPLQLAEAARVRSLQIRLDRALEALYFDTPQSPDVARLAFGMLRQLAGASAGIRWRLFSSQARGALLADTRSGQRVLDVLYDDGLFSVLDAQGRVLAPAGELFQVMASVCDQADLATLQLEAPFAEHLQARVLRLTEANRTTLPGLLGSSDPGAWRMPVRLPDGRVGYPLSGRRSRRPNPYHRRLRLLYPTYTDGQLDAWLAQAQEAPGGVEARLHQVEQEFEQINVQLRLWTSRGATRAERQRRRELRQALQNCWQHVLDQGTHGNDLIQAYRWDMIGIHTETFPELPEQANFDHVYSLTLRDAHITQLPESFLRAFSNVRSLEMPNNRLPRVPQALLQMENLWTLDLSCNLISLDPGQATILASCANLRFLDLSRNPLGRPFAVNGLIHLHELRLAGTQLRSLPYLLMENTSLRVLDLRDNQITELPEGFYESPLWVQGEVHLSGNPLTDAERERLQEALQSAASLDDARAWALARLRWMDAIGMDQRTELGACWEPLQAMQGAAQFFNLLQRLTETADFQNRTGARYLACRVMGLLQAMRDSAELRDAMFSDAEQLTCQDSVALRFSDLELRLLVWQAEASVQAGDQQQMLLHLGRQLWRMDEVDHIAMEDMQMRQRSGADPDLIEVALAYRLALRDDLDLPVNTRGMTFREVAGVNERHISQARSRVLAAESTEQLAASLLGREFWCRHLRSAYPERFEALNAPFHERLEAMQEAPGLSEMQRLEQTATIADQRQAAERTLMLELTRHALDTAVD